MKRRTVLTRAGAGIATLSAVSLAGCTGNGDADETDTGTRDSSEPLPELVISDQTFESTIDQLPIVGHQVGLRRGQRHVDIHFAVTLSITNEGNKRVDLDNYRYQIDLYNDNGTDITPGNTWVASGDIIDPGETGTALVEVSFKDSEATPEDVDSYRIILGCGSNSDAYC